MGLRLSVQVSALASSFSAGYDEARADIPLGAGLPHGMERRAAGLSCVSIAATALAISFFVS